MGGEWHDIIDGTMYIVPVEIRYIPVASPASISGESSWRSSEHSLSLTSGRDKFEIEVSTAALSSLVHMSPSQTKMCYFNRKMMPQHRCALM